MSNLFKVLFLLCAILLSFSQQYLYAQTQKFNVDSFNISVGQIGSDTAKINFIIERELSIGCDDSLSKLLLINEAKQLALKIKWFPGIYQTNRALGNLYMNCLHDHQKILEVLQENADLAIKNEDILTEAISYEAMAKNYGRFNQPDKSIEYFRKALELKPGTDLVIGILADIGHEYGLLGDYTNSITYYDSSLKKIEAEIARKKGSDLSDTSMKIGILINMADIYLAMPDPQKAMKTFEEGLITSTIIKNARFKEICLTGIGKTYKQLKQYAKANEYFQNALLESRVRNRFDDEVTILNEIANAYIDSGVYKKALEYADSALYLAEGQGYTHLLSKTNATFGNAYLKENRPDLAVFYLKKALDFSQKTHIINDQKDAWFGLYNAYRQIGQFEKSLDAYQHYINNRDSARNIEKTNEAMRKDIENTNRTERLKQAAEYEKNIQRVHYYTYGGYSGLVLVLALTFFIFRNYKTQKKYNALLSKEKKENLAHIEAQSNVLSDIAHIQAHEIRGPVSAILGFVQIYNFDDAADPNNMEIMHWIGESATKLDLVVRNVVSKENDLRAEHAVKQKK